MLMRYKPLRGEKYKIGGLDFTVLEVIKTEGDKGQHEVKMLNTSDRITLVPIRDLNLAVVDTKAYEKI